MDYTAIVTRLLKEQNLLDAAGKLIRLDSLAVIDLVAALEPAIKFRIPSDVLTQDHFASIESIVALLEELKGL